MNAVFSEIYGCYYSIVARILTEASGGISGAEIREVIDRYGFSETAYHLMPQLLGGEWKLLEKRGELYYSRLSSPPSRRPLTNLEKSWLASLLSDPRLRLFVEKEELGRLEKALSDVKPLFYPEDFVATDRNLDGDDYTDPGYIANFRAILVACKQSHALKITYDTIKGERTARIYHPYKLCYSELNDKFRLLCAAFDAKTQKLTRITLNLSRIVSAERPEGSYTVSFAELERLYLQPYDNPPIVLEVSTERNALTRFMLQFASFERRTKYDAGRNVYVCELYYDPKDETELLIMILGFGPTVKVLGPDCFLSQIKSRLTEQIGLLGV